MSKVLASVGIFVDKSEKANALSTLCNIEGVEEVYEVAGEFDILSLVSVPSVEKLRDTVQGKIMHIKGVRSVITNVILAPHRLLRMPETTKH